MTTITIRKEKKLINKTDFADMTDLYNFIVDNQFVTELGYLEESELSDEQRKALESSKKSSNLINI